MAKKPLKKIAEEIRLKEFIPSNRGVEFEDWLRDENNTTFSEIDLFKEYLKTFVSESFNQSFNSNLSWLDISKYSRTTIDNWDDIFNKPTKGFFERQIRYSSNISRDIFSSEIISKFICNNHVFKVNTPTEDEEDYLSEAS